jgi:hypothetical protein
VLCKQYWPIFEFRRNSIGQSATRSDVIHAASSALSSKKIEIEITNNCALLLNSDFGYIRFVCRVRSSHSVRRENSKYWKTICCCFLFIRQNLYKSTRRNFLFWWYSIFQFLLAILPCRPVRYWKYDGMTKNN